GRLASTHATHEAAAVVDTAYSLAGSNAIFEDRPFERRFRDIHAVTQQLQGRRAHYEHVGRYLLGLDPEITFLWTIRVGGALRASALSGLWGPAAAHGRATTRRLILATEPSSS